MKTRTLINPFPVVGARAVVLGGLLLLLGAMAIACAPQPAASSVVASGTVRPGTGIKSGVKVMTADEARKKAESQMPFEFQRGQAIATKK